MRKFEKRLDPLLPQISSFLDNALYLRSSNSATANEGTGGQYIRSSASPVLPKFNPDFDISSGSDSD